MLAVIHATAIMIWWNKDMCVVFVHHVGRSTVKIKTDRTRRLQSTQWFKLRINKLRYIKFIKFAFSIYAVAQPSGSSWVELVGCSRRGRPAGRRVELDRHVCRLRCRARFTSVSVLHCWTARHWCSGCHSDSYTDRPVTRFTIPPAICRKSPFLTHPTRIWRPRGGWPRSNFADLWRQRTRPLALLVCSYVEPL